MRIVVLMIVEVVVFSFTTVASPSDGVHWDVGKIGQTQLEIGQVGLDDMYVPIDTVRVSSGQVLEDIYHANERPEEFIFVTRGCTDSTTCYWLLNARVPEFRKLLEVPIQSLEGAVVIGCDGAKLLVSIGRSAWGELVPSRTVLLDIDSGPIIREWEGFYLGAEAPDEYPRYDETTSAIWIFPSSIDPRHPEATDRPNQLIRLDCTTCDTTWICEQTLFGEKLIDYWVPDVYRGHMLVQTREGLSKEEEKHMLRALLIDLGEQKMVGEWRIRMKGEMTGSYIAESLRSIAYYEKDGTGVVHQKLLRIGETEPVEVNWMGIRGP